MVERFYEIRDPVHGFVAITAWEREIINHPCFQRLRRIRQLAWTEMVYPGATHSRFEHSLGVMHLATRMFDAIRDKNEDILVNELKYERGDLERERVKVRLAALLHDVGHPPFSHAGEEVMPSMSDGKSFVHEHYSAAIVESLMQDVIEQHSTNQTNYHITAKEVAELLRGDPTLGRSLLWRPLITGQLDADRGDYLLRDSIHAGVAYGKYDLERLLVCVTLARDENDNPVFAIDESGWHVAESLIVARYLMFTQVYFHRTRRAYDHHISEVLQAVLKAQQRRSPLAQKERFPPPTSKRKYSAGPMIAMSMKRQRPRPRTTCNSLRT